MMKGIVFDLDGVIVDSHPAHKRAWIDFLHSLGKNPTDSDLAFILEGKKREDILRHFLGDLPRAELARFGKLKDDFFQKVSEEVVPIRGVLNFLTELASSHLPCGVATSASRRRTQLTLERLSLVQRFRVVVTGDDVTDGKPDPAIYTLAAERLGLPADSLLVFEDAPAGVKAATFAGMSCIGVAETSRAEALQRAGAAFVIPDFVDFTLDGLRDRLPLPAARLTRQ